MSDTTQTTVPIATLKEKLPSAFVTRHDEYHVWVMCPFCFKEHRHGVTSKIVQSHCDKFELHKDYLIGGVPDWTVIGFALKAREYECAKRVKKRLRVKNAKNNTPSVDVAETD